MSICVVIPMFGKEEYTRKCVDLTILNAGIPVDIVVVDDGSPIPYVDDRVTIIRLDKNSGFTAATNAGFVWAQKRNYDYVVALNNDTEPCKDFIKLLHDCIEADDTVGIAGSVRKIPDIEGNNMEVFGADLIRGFQYFVSEAELKDELITCNWLPICSSIIRMDMIREIGILDKRFKNHCSDSYYCIWAKINGWKVIAVTASVVIHHRSVTTNFVNAKVDNDQMKFLEILSGFHYAELMREFPLDCEAKTYGKIEFSVEKR